MLLLPLALAFGAEAPLPKLESPAALEAFFFPPAEEDIFDSMRMVFRLDDPGVLVSAAANAGPAYAARVAASIPSPEFQRHYALLAKIPGAVRTVHAETETGHGGLVVGIHGRSGRRLLRRGDEAGFCSGALVAGPLLPATRYRRSEAEVWCAARSRSAFPAGRAARGHPLGDRRGGVCRYRWAVAMRFQQVLRKRTAEGSEREAILDAAHELEQDPVNRERAALALLQMMLRTYENVHLRHLSRLRKAPL
jgi:hypothetical protein